MSELGEILRKERLEQGITLDELEEQTKIRKRYLEAIEDGNYNVLPGKFYVRAFIKSYAEAVGLDPTEVMMHYKNAIPNPEPEQPLVETSRKSSRRISNTDKLAKWASSLLLLSFIVLIFAVIYAFVINRPNDPNESIADPTKLTDRKMEMEHDVAEVDQDSGLDETVEEPESFVHSEEENVEVEVSFLGSESTTNVYTVNHTEELIIELSAVHGSCWTQVREVNDTGEVIKEQTYAIGESDSWTVTTPLWIRMGNPNAVEVRVNGVLLEEEELQSSSPWNIQVNLGANSDSPA